MHNHDWHELDHISAPTNGTHPVGHTKFLVLACVCGIATPFPVENYFLTTPNFRRTYEERLLASGLTMDTTI